MRHDNPASGLENDDNPAKASRLLSPSDLATIFASTPRKLLPAVGLQALCGVRVAEVARLQWNDIEDGTLYLVGTKTKTGLDRSTPIPSALARYLESQRDRDGQAYIFPYKSVVGTTKEADLEDFNRNKQLSKAVGVLRARVKAQGIRWERNSLRVSALSYRNAIVKNAHQVAEEMGNSAHIFKRIYQQSRVKEADAKRWFDTDPARPGVKGFRDPSTIRAEAKETLAKWDKTNAKAEEESARRAESKDFDDDLDGFTSTSDPNDPED
jgi:integrase